MGESTISERLVSYLNDRLPRPEQVEQAVMPRAAAAGDAATRARSGVAGAFNNLMRRAFDAHAAETPPMPAARTFDAQFNTVLPADAERAFEAWKAQHAPRDSGADYDLRGAFKEGLQPGADAHWSDEFKKPNHPTFSDQSRYAPYGAPGRWSGDWNPATRVYTPPPGRPDRFIPPVSR